MPLSDDERRRLEALEEQLSEDDPRLARNLGDARPDRKTQRRKSFAVLAILAGLALVITGIAMQMPVIGAAGFALQCAGAYWFSATLGLFDGYSSLHFGARNGKGAT
ncbi:DUF3040 domain-containing protein [Arthrobacter sp. D1-29]